MKVHRLLSVDRDDLPKLWALAPIFCGSAAVTVVLASLSKALFLSQNPIALLPWTFLGAAAVTAGLSFVYLALLERVTLKVRAYGLVLAIGATLVALRVAFATAPQAGSLAILLVCPAAGSLLVMQTWNLATSTLPTRQGKRLFPVLAALTTAGAVAGGLSVQGLTLWLATEDLLLVSAAFLFVLVVRVGPTTRRMGSDAVAEPEEKTSLGQRMDELRANPMLAELALFVFLLQCASLLIDYQLSAEIQPRFDKEGIARFLGTFYWTSNSVVLLLATLATSRVVRKLGIGITLATSGLVLGLGSALYVLAARTPWMSGFWVIAGTAFAERIAQYAFTKPAMQMAYMPLQGKGGESAKAIVDGVVYRVATALVSVLLLVAAPSVATQFRLSPPAVVACVVVVYIGARFGPHYRRAVFEALAARRLDPRTTLFLRDGLGDGALHDLERQLAHRSPRRVQAALEIARELTLPLPSARVLALAESDDAGVARAALDLLQQGQRELSTPVLVRLLRPDRPPRVLRMVLDRLGTHPAEPIDEAVHELVHHVDPAVAAAACLVRIRAAGDDVAKRFSDEVVAPENARGPALRVTGMTRAGDFARELPRLLGDARRQVREEAIGQMGQLRLAYFRAPLVACLTAFDTREAAVKALAGYGDACVEEVTTSLDERELGLPARVALLKVLEGVGSTRAIAELVAQAASSEATLRDHAVSSLTRLASANGAKPAAKIVRKRVLEELDRMKRYAKLAVLAATPTARMQLFQRELNEARRDAERRALGLLGLVFDREAMQRVALHVHSSDARARSNALELLEQHVGNSAMRGIVRLLERSAARSLVATPAAEVADLLQAEPWLGRVWQWALDRGDAPRQWSEPIDRAMELIGMSVFGELSGEALITLCDQAKRVVLEPGETLCRVGDLDSRVHVLLEGSLDVAGADQPLGVGACVGLVSALDGESCAATLSTDSGATLLRVSANAFADAAELSPRLMRAAIAVLTGRLREVRR